MFLAEWFAFFREEHLTLQTDTAHRAHKASIMPGESKSFQKRISCFYWEVTTTASCPKPTVIISLAVRFSILQVKSVVPYWLLARCTQEAVHMPGLLKGINHFPHDFVLAACAGRGEELFVTVLAVNRAFLLNETQFTQRHAAVSARKLLRVPRFPHRHQKRTPDDHVTVCTHRSAFASWDVLCHLDQ